MPERWQQELKKLRREEMPEDVRHLAGQHPQGELEPERRQRVAAGIVAFAVFVAAGVFAWRALGTHSDAPQTEPAPSVGDALVLRFDANDGDPSATLAVASQTQHGIQEGYEWCGDGQTCVSGIGDFATYPPVTEYVPLDAGTVVAVQGDAEHVRVEVSLPDAERVTDGDVVRDGSVLDRPGRYVWNAKATWADGNANFFFGVQVLPPPDEVPDVLHVTCTPRNAVVSSSVVRAQADGVHIAVAGSGDVTGADVVRGVSPDDFVGIGVAADADGSRGLPIEPGSWYVGCYAGSNGGVGPTDINTSRTAGFQVIDPHGFDVPDQLSCDRSTTSSVAGRSDGTGDFASLVGSVEAALPGLRSTDEVRGPGYLGTAFRDGPHLVVIRDGAVIATLGGWTWQGDDASWSAQLAQCADAGLLDEDAPTSSAPATPTVHPAAVSDVAVVRCGDGDTRLATPIVNARPDGVHVRVADRGSASEVAIQPASGPAVGSEIVTSDPIVLAPPPGPARIGCMFTNDRNAILGGADEHPGWFVPIEIRDPNGLYVSPTLSCPSSEQVLIGPERRPTDHGGVAASIRADVAGIADTDVVERAGYPNAEGGFEIWRVLRDGDVVAALSVTTLLGSACAGTGIGGA